VSTNLDDVATSLSADMKANGLKLDRIIELLELFQTTGDRVGGIVDQIKINTAKPRQSA
jgi:hypothetical protein